ncbi:MAG: MATE family efflux transporter [Lachnospiraceae bacterium]|nr:MATE family efflux transporter [Lachnospiraceae bacterium]
MQENNEKESAKAQYQRMTEQPVSVLIRQLSAPTIVSMLVTNLYNMADTYFVSSLGTSASGATGVVFGLMSILQAFGFMFGHGAGSNISRQLGARDAASAKHYSAVSFYLSIFAGLAVLILGLVFLNPLMRLLGSTDTILPYARTYAFWILLAAPAMTSACVMNNILRYEGMAFYAMLGLTSGGILNIFGDALLIRGFHMGIEGAGISTAVTQYISCVILALPYLRGKTRSSLSPRYFSLDFPVIGNICLTGTPSLVRQGLGAVSTMVMNNLAGGYGDAAVAAVSIVNRVVLFLNCVTIGIGQGFQPVSAFNFGARKYSRVKGGFFFSLKYAEGIMVALGVLAFVFAPDIIRLFREDPEVIAVGTPMMRLQCAGIVFSPLSVFGDMMFQSIGKAKTSAFLATMRRGILLIPSALVLNALFGLNGLEFSQGICDVLTGLVTLPFVAAFLRHLPADGTPMQREHRAKAS